MTSRSNPSNWDEYQYGTSASHRGSVSSAGGRSVRFGEQEESESSALLGTTPRERTESGQQGDLRRRRQVSPFYSARLY